MDMKSSISKKLGICFLLCMLLLNSININAYVKGAELKTNLNTVTIPSETNYLKNEFRAAWVASVYNIDWPSRTGLSVTQQKQEMLNIFDSMQNLSMNAVVFQIRTMGDAFYPSNYSPWSKYLTGTLGVSPGYDPLQYAVDEAHKRNLEFHAWFNPFRISADSNFDKQAYLDKLPAASPLKNHPEWIVNYEGYNWLNPGIPEARDYVIDTILEVVKNYDIDAVHLDDYFYPYPRNGKDFIDDNEYAYYGSGYSSKADWRRDNVNKFIYELSTKIKNEKSYVKFGVSPFGIWRNKSDSVPEGSVTNGLSSYDTLYVDSVKWVNEGWLDYIAPQIYWNFGFSLAAYENLIEWWTNQVKGKSVSLYIGQAAYRIGESSTGPWANPGEIPNQIRYNRTFPDIKGSIFFSISDINDNRLGIKDALQNDLYKYKALIPPMPKLDNVKPRSPLITSIQETADGIDIKWSDNVNKDADSYIIYRFEAGKPVNIQDPKSIINIIKKNSSGAYSFIDRGIHESDKYSYAITAVDRLHNESDEVNAFTLGKARVYDINADKPSPQKIYTPIRFTASASGPGTTLYRFSIDDGLGWKVVSDYSGNTTFDWVPRKRGEYKLKVDVKDSTALDDLDSSKEISYTVNGSYKIMLDPGHGGGDDGATGITGVYEKNINLLISEKVRKKLMDYGFEVYTTRNNDTYVGLSQRADMANNLNADIYISIHQNSFDENPEVNGIETYSYPGSIEGQKLAQAVQTSLILNTNAVDRNVKSADFAVIRETNMPAILIECGFLSNSMEEEKLKSNDYEDKICDAITEGAIQYLNINKADINKDSIVDMLDIASISRSYNSKYTDSIWNGNFDVNDDGVVNLLDLLIAAKQLR